MLHAYTKNPEHITSEADIVVVVDVGVPNIVRGNWLKKGAVVIDMGTNQVKVMIFFFSILVVPRCAMM